MGIFVSLSHSRKNKLKFEKTNRKTMKRKNKVRKWSTIENLNDNCLIEIFKDLSLDDLINVSVSSARFKVSSCIVFKKNFAKNVIVDPDKNRLRSVVLLKTFGHLIDGLTVIYKEDYNRFNQELDQAIIKYSAESVTEIEFIKSDKFLFNNQIVRPLAKVTKVTFIRCVVGRCIFEFNKWFPNAHSLELLESTIVSTSDAMCIEQPFPKLTHLAIINPKQHCEYQTTNANIVLLQPLFTNGNTEMAIHLNPQIKSLKLKHNHIQDEFRVHATRFGIEITPAFLHYISDKLPLLTELELLMDTSIGNTTQEVVHFENLEGLKFVVECTSDLRNCLITTGKPAKLTITSEYLNKHCLQFLQKNKMWRKIVFHGNWELFEEYEPVSLLLPQFPILNSVVISVNGMDGCMEGNEREILSLLTKCKSLKKLKVCFSTEEWKHVNRTIRYPVDTTDLDREELRFLESIKYLRDVYAPAAWRLSERESNYWEQEVLGDPTQTIEEYGHSILEMYRHEFDGQRLSSWQSNYHKQGSFFVAAFRNKDWAYNQFYSHPLILTLIVITLVNVFAIIALLFVSFYMYIVQSFRSL